MRVTWVIAAVVLVCGVMSGEVRGAEAPDPLPSWNEGAAKAAIIAFVKETTEKGSPKFVPEEERIVTFDQDGTLWVEHPMYTQVMYCLERVPAVVAAKPELREREPFKTVMSGDLEKISKLPMKELEVILAATLTGMTVEQFDAEVRKWMEAARDARWKRPYTELIYQPMLEVMQYMREHGYRTYIVTGGGQDFVRAYAQKTYGIPPEQVVGSIGEAKFEHNQEGRPVLMKEPKLLLNNNEGGKPEGIHMVIGRRPRAAFGNTAGDQAMLEYTGAGEGSRMMMLVLHDDGEREYAYGPANGLPESKVGTFSQALYDDAKSKGWTVISMKGDWKRVFGWEKGK